MKAHSFSRILLTLVSFFLVAYSYCQKNKTDGNQQWIQYYNSIRLSENWGIYSDFGLRFRNLEEVSQTLVRSGLGYQPNSQTRLVAGFAFLTFHKSGSSTKVEYRPYQEVTLTQSFSKIDIKHRFRSEQRIFSATDESDIKSSFNHRFRYRILTNIPLVKKSGNETQLSLTVGDEILINAGKEIEYNMFDGNRILIGPALQFSNNLNISLIYNRQFGQKNEANSFASTHVFWIGIKHKIHVMD